MSECGNLSESIQTMLNGRLVQVGHMVEFRFAQPSYIWNGSRAVETLDGKTWYGLRQLGSIEGLEEESDNLQSTQLKLTISGVDSDLLRTAVSEDRADYVGRLVIIWLQFFDEAWRCLDYPVAFKAGIIDGIEVSRAASDDGQITRRLSVTAQNLFYGRGLPPYSYYSNRDQQLRHPGDRGLELVAELLDTTIQVPW